MQNTTLFRLLSLPLPSEGAFLQRDRAELHRAAHEDFPVRHPRRERGHSLRSVRRSIIDVSNPQVPYCVTLTFCPPPQAGAKQQHHRLLPPHHRRGRWRPDDCEAALGEGRDHQLVGLVGRQKQVPHPQTAHQVWGVPVQVRAQPPSGTQRHLLISRVL